ncbi:hypothetical protein MUY35_14755 [Aliiroseovarius sp. S1339]|uniref:6-pyruvoyl-tetrahydropterin synthase-related protein n=1 Tax=Aliiroseovarius sp. S1339 TaxID=2936990 RepID=UPI0020BE5002|nr:6-pyruvoyl-tetrahydropterin synthase-related protein [Aliiroseovarius sp. S1339]MCK8465116.1 hypothetical protein [Aliiroseovarius sp. S1339]
MFWQNSFVAALAAIGLFLFVLAGFSNGDSALYNYPWTVQYINAFDGGAFLPRHLPGLWAGLGGYDFFFYAPLPFWFMAAITAPVCTGCTPETTFVLTAGLFWLLGGVTVGVFLRRFFDPRPAIIGAIAYLLLPYHLWIDWFMRQAVGEFAAYAFLPLVALGFDAIRLQQRRGWILAVGVAGVTLCHLPTALLAAHVFAALTLVILVHLLRHKQNLTRFLLPLIGWTTLGGLLSCFYWLPAIMLLDTVSPDALYTSHFVAERWLFRLPFDPPNLIIAKAILFGFLAVLPFIVVAAVYARGALRLWIIVPVALSLFLNLEVSEFIWQHWMINRVQFPWRLMIFVDFSAAIAVAFVAAKLPGAAKIRTLSVLAVLTVYPIIQVVISSLPQALKSYDTTYDQAGAIEYLSPEMLRVVNDRVTLMDGRALKQRDVSAVVRDIWAEWESATPPTAQFERTSRHATVTPAQDVARLSVPLQYWVLWRAELDDGHPLQTAAYPRFGTLDIIAPPEGFRGRTITLTLPWHSSEKAGFTISFLAVLLLGATLFGRQRRTVLRRIDATPKD